MISYPSACNFHVISIAVDSFQMIKEPLILSYFTQSIMLDTYANVDFPIRRMHVRRYIIYISWLKPYKVMSKPYDFL